MKGDGKSIPVDKEILAPIPCQWKFNSSRFNSTTLSSVPGI
jgi:hypothetical protein